MKISEIFQRKKLSQDEIEPQGETRYQWSKAQSCKVNLLSIMLVSIVLPVTLNGVYQITRYNLWFYCYKEAIFLFLCFGIMVCWSILWWGQLKRQLISARRGLLKEHRMLTTMVLIPGIAHTIACFSGDQNLGSESFIVIYSTLLIGVDIGLDFLRIFEQYRRDIGEYRFKQISFIDFCNMPKSTEE